MIRIAVTALVLGLLVFGADEASAQQQRFDPSLILLPPISQQSSSETPPRPSKADVVATQPDVFSPEARLALRLGQIEKRLDQIIRQNTILKQQLDQANATIGSLEERMDAHGRSTSFGTNGMSLINMVQQIWAKSQQD